MIDLPTGRSARPTMLCWLVIFPFLFISRIAVAQSGWAPLESGTSKRLDDAVFTSWDNGFVFGREGDALRTTDGGTSWHQMKFGGIDPGFSINFESSHFLNLDTGFVIGYVKNPNKYLCYSAAI